MISIVIVVFLVLFALVMVVVGGGMGLFQRFHLKRLRGELDSASPEETETANAGILKDTAEQHSIDNALKATPVAEALQRQINQADLDWSAPRVLLMMAVGAGVGAVLGWMLRPLGFASLSAVGGSLLLGGAPLLILKRKRDKRLREIEAQLPDALDFLARSMRAGHAFSISLEMLGNETPAPLGMEIRTLFNEVNLGAPLDTALKNFASRIPLVDVRLMVSSILLQKQTGGNLGEVLTRLAYVIRERFRLRGQVRAVTAHGRMTALTLTIIPVFLVLALTVIAPGYLRVMVEDSTGRWMVLGAVAAQVTGYLIMRHISNIKV
jgi:tight adherence protein B